MQRGASSVNRKVYVFKCVQTRVVPDALSFKVGLTNHAVNIEGILNFFQQSIPYLQLLYFNLCLYHRFK